MSVRARWIAATASASVLALAGVLVAVWRPTAGAPAPEREPVATATITRESLVDIVTVNGKLAYGPPALAESRLPGTLTALAPIGSTVQRGQELFRIDDTPVVLMYGAVPAYRDLTAGKAAVPSTDPAVPATPAVAASRGKDVQQFEQNLKALGYGGFTVDDKYNGSTAAAVKKWQKALHRPETGVVTPADIVYATGQIRIEEQSVGLGAPGSGQVLTYTGTQKVVTVSVDAGDHAWATPGAPVTVKLPGGTEVAGKVDKVATEATAEGQQQGADNAALSVTVTIPDQSKLGDLAKTPVDVRYVADERKDVLTVPVSALLALSEGGYGLEVLDSTGTHTVAVQVGLFAGGKVEVSGDSVTEGLSVGMPS